MSSKPATKPPIATPSGDRPRVTSYDSGYEHSLEHWLEVQQLVEAADMEFKSASAPLAVGRAS